MLKSENAAVFALGGIGYGLLEMLWRGRTHWTMMVTGGLCLLILYRADRGWRQEMLVFRCIKGAILITCVEFIVGVVVNMLLRWNVWDYSRSAGNLLGQVCPMYFLLWYFLCYPIGLLNRILRKTLGKRMAD